MRDDQAAAIWLYTSEGLLYQEITSKIQEGDMECIQRHYLPYLRILFSSFSSLQSLRSRIVYGYSKCDLFSKKSDVFAVGNLVRLKGFGSVTTNLHKLKKESKIESSPASGVLFQIKTQQGVSVGRYSPSGDEEEVLLPFGVFFKVTKVIQPSSHEMGRIYLEDDDGGECSSVSSNDGEREESERKEVEKDSVHFDDQFEYEF